MRWCLAGKGAIGHVAKEAERLMAMLRERGQEVIVESDLAAALGVEGRPLASLEDEIDIVMTVGGDGTILHCQGLTQKPVLGINVGAIGFLAEVEPAMAEDAIDRVLAGKHRVEERHKLAVYLADTRLPDAVNEATLQTSRIAKLIRFRVEVDGEVLDTFRGDGIIISTPTGSTGYAMSVGGPLVHPGVTGLVLAPIAPFKLAARPWVVPDQATIEVTLLERDSAQGAQQARVVVDGQHGFDMETGAVLRVEASRHKARFVRMDGGFYERVRTKLTR